MRRLWFLVPIVVSACVADSGGEAIQIRQNLAPADDSCTFMPSTTAAFLSRGAIDLSSPVPYVLTPLIESRISAVMGTENMRTVALRGARVDLELGPISVEAAGGGVTIVDFSDAEQAELVASGAAKFRSLFSAPLAPNGGLTTSSFDIVSTPALAAIRAKVAGMPGRVHAQAVATIVVYGDLGGDEVESVPFVYPVTVCNDCVINNLGLCPAPTGTMVRKGNACNMFQDGVVDCCTMDGALICPAMVE